MNPTPKLKTFLQGVRMRKGGYIEPQVQAHNMAQQQVNATMGKQPTIQKQPQAKGVSKLKSFLSEKQRQ